ncbi:MAG: hypothetical protein ACI4AD_13805 [Roseburia sp.]
MKIHGLFFWVVRLTAQDVAVCLAAQGVGVRLAAQDMPGGEWFENQRIFGLRLD